MEPMYLENHLSPYLEMFLIVKKVGKIVGPKLVLDLRAAQNIFVDYAYNTANVP